jgi:hypothetical protein
MFGRERSLAAQFEGKPFVVLGVNAEESREALRQVEAKERLPWRSWWDGPGGALGAAWGVDRYPSFFLIDPHGVIRYRHAGAPPAGALEERIERLLKQTSG